jgi:Flp pilus assembly protein TadG
MILGVSGLQVVVKSRPRTLPRSDIPSLMRDRCDEVSSVKRNRIGFRRASSGQALIESAILIPFLLMIIFNGINFGYFYYVTLNMSASTRSGALFAILGPETPVGTSFPNAGPTTTVTSVSNVMYQDMAGALPSAATNASVQVCSSTVGVLNPGTTTQKADCTAFGSLTFSGGAGTDPEAPTFTLHQVNIKYQFTPLIPGRPFGAILLATSVCTGSPITCTFQRKVLMRAM